MASPPPSTTPLALPRQRPSLALPGQPHAQSQPVLSTTRKPSFPASTTTTPSLHPLRQTSFPPPAHPGDSLEAQHAAAAAADDAAALRLAQYSPSQASDLDLEDEFSDSEIVSAISGPATNLEDAAGAGGSVNGAGVTRKRKRGEKKPRGRPAKAKSIFSARTGSVSLVNGEAGGAASETPGRGGGERGGTAGADDEDDNDDEDDDDAGAAAATTGGQGGRLPLYEGGALAPHEFQTDTESKSRFRLYMENLDSLPLTSTTPSREGLTVRDMSERYDVYQRAKLRNQDLRRLVNQTLSQSVPSNVVTVVSSYTKMFAGLIVEEARRVQGEWMAVETKRADGGENFAYERLKAAEIERLRQEGEDTEAEEKEAENATPAATALKTSPPLENEKSPAIKAEPAPSNPSTPLPTTQTQTQPNETPPKSNAKPDPIHPGGAGGLFPSVAECDRGPLQPDHLREALRRYKKASVGGTVGFTGLSLEGRESAAVRMGGRRLFR